ncbi:MAG: helix-turn-helix transcriptional regulator [Mycobacterium sp.]|nr:helix-turn-helix transcriptional regulator [Mycobacterium sp.]
MSGRVGQHELAARVAAQVRALRNARGWTGQRLAQEMARLGIAWDRYTVTNLERGRRQDVTVDELQALADVFDIKYPWLLTAARPACPQCNGAPPAGFRCLGCGQSGHQPKEARDGQH